MNKKLEIDIGDLEVPVLPLHPAFGGTQVEGNLRVRTELRAGSLTARANIVQAYPAAVVGIDTSFNIVGGGG